MPINKETIISVFDEKLTLMQWLKTINKALDEAVLTGVEVRQKGNATFSFVVTFEDGTELESNEFVLAQGESINGATIRNGHLYLSLTNGDELDAGNLKPVTSFTINESQHLIVNYGDGTSQDLGAIFSGNVNIEGTFNANKVTGDEIVENMTGYSFSKNNSMLYNNVEFKYIGITKNGNKLTTALFAIITPHTLSGNYDNLGTFYIPSLISNKLYPYSQGGLTNVLEIRKVDLKKVDDINATFNEGVILVNKGTNSFYVQLLNNSLVVGENYVLRFEITFLLSDNLAV